jgi:hypothetical protein
MPYVYRVSRRSLVGEVGEPAKPVPPTPVEPTVTYRDLQAQAKALDIPANQTADDLKKAIEEAESDV